MSAGSSHARILVVDDDQGAVLVLSQRLSSWGYEVLTAASGEEALRVVEEVQPDLILLDVMMPSMKGREVCASLKARPATRRIPVVFLSVMDLPDHIRAGLEAGADDYITKPYDPEDLKARIGICLSRHRTKHSTPP